MKKPILLVMAAGMGHRFGGIKQIESITENGETLLDFNILNAIKCGCDKVVFVIRKDIEKDFNKYVFNRISKYVDSSYVFQELTTLVPQNLKSYVENRTKPFGTVQCVLAAKDKLDAPFITLNADDYYGYDATKNCTDYLINSNDKNCLVGYKLINTLSPTGTVTRGVCTVENGSLKKIDETFEIGKSKDGIFGKDINGNKVELNDDTVVSMNLFGFDNSIISDFENHWEKFISLYYNDPKKECILVDAVCSAMKEKGTDVKLLNTVSKWVGMTYKEDKQNIKEYILSLIEQGKFKGIV